MQDLRPSNARLWLSVIGINAVWLISVLCAAYGWAWVGPVCAVAFAGVMLSGSREYLADAWLIVLAVALGFILDGSLMATGLMSFPEPAAWGKPVPLWMLGLWVNLAACLPVCLYWLIQKPFIAAVFGAVGGPLAYYSGQRLGAVTLESITAYIVLAAVWAVIMVVFCVFVDKTRGMTQRMTTPEQASTSEPESSKQEAEPDTTKPLPGAGAGAGVVT